MAGTACQRSPSSANHAVARVAERHLEHGVLGEVEQPRTLPGDLHDQRQDIERRAGSAWPAEVTHGVGEVGVARVPDDRSVRLAVAGIADQLLVPDPRAGSLGRVRGEHGEGRSHPSAVGGLPQVRERFGGHLRGGGDMAAVAHPQAAPVEPADAAAAVAPGSPGPKRQLCGGVSVGTVALDLGADLLNPRTNRPDGRVLGLVEGQKLLSCGQVDLPRCRRLAKGRPDRRGDGISGALGVYASLLAGLSVDSMSAHRIPLSRQR